MHKRPQKDESDPQGGDRIDANLSESRHLFVLCVSVFHKRMCEAHQQGHFHFLPLLIHSNKQPSTKNSYSGRGPSRDRVRSLGFSPQRPSVRARVRVELSRGTSNKVDRSQLLIGDISHSSPPPVPLCRSQAVLSYSFSISRQNVSHLSHCQLLPSRK